MKQWNCLFSAALACLVATPALAFDTNSFTSTDIDNRISKCDQFSAPQPYGTVKKNVDGDTIHVTATDGNTYSVRMLGMDTPETHYYGHSQGEWGDRAAEVLSQIIPVGAPVTLEYGTTACDMHGRLLAHVWAGNMHANAEMVKRGLAVNYCVAPDFKYCDEFAQYTSLALNSAQGMFSDPSFELPYDFRRRISNNEERSYVGNLETKEVHSPGHEKDVEIPLRVFFFERGDIQYPYQLVD